MASNFSIDCDKEKLSLNETGMNCTSKRWHDNSRGLNTTKFVVLITFHLIVAVAALFGNYLMLRAFHKFQNLRTASNVILASLSIADGLLGIPSILDIIYLSLSVEAEHRSGILRKISASSTFLLMSVIILHLALISLERSIAVRFALRYHIIVTNRRALIVSIAMWLWAVVVIIVFPKVLKASSDDFEQLRQAMNPYSETRKEPPNDGPPPLTQGYLVFQMITLLVIPLFIILCSYSYIFIVSNRHRKQIREQADISGLQQRIKHEMKGARTLAVVIAVCLLSIIPLLVVTCLRFFGKLSECGHPERRPYKFIVYDVATGLNAICNPLIYGWKNKEFRRAFVKVLKCA